MEYQTKYALKRILALALAAVMTVSLGACGKDKEKPEEKPADSITSEAPETPKEKSEITAPNFSTQIAEARTKNDEIIGWLQIPDTKIDGAVVQTGDNQFYQRKDEWKNYSWTGSYFADFECDLTNRSSLSKNSIIYGHNVHYDDNKDKERFSQLFHFTDLDFAKNHPYVYFSIASPSGAETPPQNADPSQPTGAANNPETEMVWQIFSVFYTKTDFNYIQVKKDPKSTDPDSEELTEAQLMNIVNEAKARSEYTYDVEVTGKDKILTLSTCSYKYGRRNDVRFVVMAKLMEQDAPLKSSIELKENKSKKAVE